MVVSLAYAMYTMMQDTRGDKSSNRTVNALTWRIGIWVVLLGFIIGAAKFGWINPSNSISMDPEQHKAAQADSTPKSDSD